MPTTVLGSHKRKFVFQCSGVLAEDRAEDFAAGFIRAAGMNPARPGRIDRYPYRGGGGTGYTGYFPLMESYLILDIYTDLYETEILLSTCKPDRINLDTLTQYLKKWVGPVKDVQTT